MRAMFPESIDIQGCDVVPVLANRDGRGSPAADDDRIMRIVPIS